MISLKDKILSESILGSVGAGKNGIKDKIEQWIAQKDIKNYVLNDDLSLVIKDGSIDLTEPIPDYIKITRAKTVYAHSEEILHNLPKIIGWLIIDNCEIKDFTMMSDIILGRFGISNCDIKSLKGIPSPQDRLYIGNNKQHFSKKELKKAGVTTKPNEICNIGCVNRYGEIGIGENDIEYISKEMEVLRGMYSKLLPEMKIFNYNCRKDNSHVYIILDFLSQEEHPNNISDNSIYISFSYELNGSIFELRHTGHLELTQKDREGKYKYYALKGFADPYYDKGGKRFRTTRLDVFTAKEIFYKTKDWIRAVVDAALEDQGGELKRRR